MWHALDEKCVVVVPNSKEDFLYTNSLLNCLLVNNATYQKNLFTLPLAYLFAIIFKLKKIISNTFMKPLKLYSCNSELTKKRNQEENLVK